MRRAWFVSQRARAAEDLLEVTADVVELRRDHVVLNELEGALIRLAAYASLSKRRIDLEFAVAVVDEQQAAIIQRIFTEYLANRRLKAIAHQLNHEGVPSPSAGRRGSGS